jgi:hypothetical protein
MDDFEVEVKGACRPARICVWIVGPAPQGGELLPRANRHFFPDVIWHPTHPSHRDELLLKCVGDQCREELSRSMPLCR